MGDSVADADLEHDSADLAFSESVFDMAEQPCGDAPLPVLGSDADGRQMSGVVLVDHDKCKTDQFALRRDHPIAQSLWLIEQIFKSVFCIVIAVSETADVEAENIW